MAFERRTELFIGIFKDVTNADIDGYLIDGLDYEFDVTRSTEFYKDSATFTIYNPNEETVQEIMNAGTAVIFRVGYKDEDMGVVFVGQVGTAYTESEGPSESKITVVCNSQRGAQYQLQRTFMSAVYEKGDSYYSVLKGIADYVGVPLSGAEVLKKNVLEDDYVVSGSIRDAVTNFVSSHLRAIGGKVIISNNEMIYLGAGNSLDFETAYLTYKTGLVSAKAKRDETFQSSEDAFQDNMEYYLGLASMGDKDKAEEKAKEAKVPKKNKVEFQCLMHPGIQIDTPVYIDARVGENDHNSVLGKFYVTTLHIQGDSFGGQFLMSGIAEEKDGVGV